MQAPNMAANALMFAIKLKIYNNIQDVVDHEPVQISTVRNITATVQPADPERLKVEDVDLSLKYLMVHTLPSTLLKIDDWCEYQGVKYKCIQASDYNVYGYLLSTSWVKGFDDWLKRLACFL